MEDKPLSMEEIKNQIGVINFSKDVEEVKETFEEKKEPNVAKNIIDEVHKQAIIQTVRNDKDIQEKIVDKAKTSIENEMNVLDKEEIKRVQDATYDANKEACECFGIEQGVQVWKIKAMRLLHDFWFVVYLVFAFFTICPVSVFCKGLKKFIKSNWLVVVCGIIIYLIIIGTPILLTYLKTLGIEI